MKRPPLTKEGLIFWLQRFRSLDTTKKEHKQRLIDSFVNAVYVYDDKLVLTFNYNEANTTVTLDEVNGSIIECSGAPEKTTCFDRSFFQLSLPLWATSQKRRRFDCLHFCGVHSKRTRPFRVVFFW